MKFIVMGDSIETYPDKKTGSEKSIRRLLLLGEGEDLAEQLCEFNLPAETPAIGRGRVINLKIKEISSMFGGKPRLRGVIKLMGASDVFTSEAEVEAEEQG